MRSVDTNVLIRVLVRDNVAQAASAEEVLAGPILLLSTVIMETVRVLETVARWSRDGVATGLEEILAIENGLIPDEVALRWTIDRYRAGGDFADMLHVALSGVANSFVTFDRRIARFARDASVEIETL